MLLRVFGLAFAHFIVAFGIAALAFGLDMDQLRSRSPVSRCRA
jgi:hypothetical protein